MSTADATSSNQVGVESTDTAPISEDLLARVLEPLSLIHI